MEVSDVSIMIDILFSVLFRAPVRLDKRDVTLRRVSH